MLWKLLKSGRGRLSACGIPVPKARCMMLRECNYTRMNNHKRKIGEESFKDVLGKQSKKLREFENESTLDNHRKKLDTNLCKSVVTKYLEITSLKSEPKLVNGNALAKFEMVKLLPENRIPSEKQNSTIEMYEQPKNTLNLFYYKVAKMLDCPKYILNKPTFMLEKELWTCKYIVPWPARCTFESIGFTKKEASHKAATSLLQWLEYKTCIDRSGKPHLHSLPQLNGARLYSTTSSTLSDVVLDDPKYVNINPKSILHNYFVSVSNQLTMKDLKFEPHYKVIKDGQKSTWMCTYNLKWPEPLKFSVCALSKQEASTKAAEKALFWLKDNGKITKDGRPIISDQEVAVNFGGKQHPCLSIDCVREEKLTNIVDMYEKHFVPQLVNDLPSDTNEHDIAEELQEKWPEKSYSKRMLKIESPNFYMAKEPVELPISKYRKNIIKQLNNNRVLIIKGEPGCGKSTRVPQYVLEAWASSDEIYDKPCRIVVTQPRRIAAISLAERVADEREENVGNTVGYHVRLDSQFNRNTGRIMYCTTGILLRRLQHDPKLSDCSHVILDEAHERDVNIDLLMNLLKYALKLNPNLKLLVMSATLDTKVFQQYFDNAPLLHIPGFTYPVEQRFLNDDCNEVDLVKTYQMCRGNHPTVIHEDVVRVIKFIHKNRGEGAVLCFLPGWDEITKVKNLLEGINDMLVLCLHSKLQVSEQRKIFKKPPLHMRKVILSTNIAETSVTINDVGYVVDTGIHKEERFDAGKGVSCVDNYWVSQASAIQRSGRAGRCRAGECFHLYPESKYKELAEYSMPEILRTSLTKIVLDSKVYSNNMIAEEFLQQLICPPEKSAIESAVDELKELELLDENENLTPLGRKVSDFQLCPKLSKAMVNAVIFKCVTPVVDIATLFSADNSMFAKTLVDKEGIKDVKQRYSKNSDHIAAMNLFEKWLDYVDNEDISAAINFCERSGMAHPRLVVMNKLRDIHSGYLQDGLNNALPLSDDLSDNSEIVKGVILSGVGTILQHRIKQRPTKVINAFFTRYGQKATITSESVNSRKAKFPSEYLMYINETVSNLRHTTLVRETSVISPLTVFLFKSGELEIETLDANSFSDKIPSTDQVLLKLKGSRVVAVCDRKHATAIKKCKEALHGITDYYIFQLTKGNNFNKNLNDHWQNILLCLSDVLNIQES